jgi:hypothetical protein
MNEQFRELSVDETALLRRLLAVEFPGSEELRLQLAAAQARTVDDDGSIELQPAPTAPAAAVMHRVPVEAAYRDEDGVEVHVLLHVVGGFLHELEFFKDNGSTIRRRPAPESLTATVA